MITAHNALVRRTAARFGARAVSMMLSVLAAMAATVLMAACATNPPREPSASDVVRSLGAVPIPSAGPAESTPSATPGDPALLAIGGPVQVTLADGSQGLVTALGPEQVATAPPSGTSATGYPKSTRAVITLRVAMTTGAASIRTSDLSSRNESGAAIHLTPVGPATAHAGPTGAVTLRVAATFSSGAAQVTWRHNGAVIAVWTFNIELD